MIYVVESGYDGLHIRFSHIFSRKCKSLKSLIKKCHRANNAHIGSYKLICVNNNLIIGINI